MPTRVVGVSLSGRRVADDHIPTTAARRAPPAPGCGPEKTLARVAEVSLPGRLVVDDNVPATAAYRCPRAASRLG